METSAVIRADPLVSLPTPGRKARFADPILFLLDDDWLPPPALSPGQVSISTAALQLRFCNSDG